MSDLAPKSDRDYLQHLLAVKKMKPGALAREAKLSPSTLTRPLNDPDYKFSLSLPTIKALEEATGISYAAFMSGHEAPPPSNASFPPKYQQFAGERSVPLKGQTVTGPNGRFVLNGQDLDRVFAPPNLLSVDGGYAVQVFGTSMEPAFRAGMRVWLDPAQPVRAGDFVVAQIYTDDDEVESYLKEYISTVAGTLTLRQLKPAEGESHIMEFPADRAIVHKVIFSAFP